mgnify:CR=1 FL=1
MDYGEWRAVPGIDPNLLLVSSKGWARTLRRGGRVAAGAMRPLGKPTRGTKNANELRSVAVQHRQWLIHRLVALAFIGPQPPDKPEVDHIDRDVDNNDVSNLRWASRTDNCQNKGKARPSYLQTSKHEPQEDIEVNGVRERWARVTDRLWISTMGRVQRKHRRGDSWMCKVTPTPSKRKAGYVYIKVEDNKAMLLHRLVMLAFEGQCTDPEKKMVDHINGKRSDNRLSNLRWATAQQNGLNAVTNARRTFQDLPRWEEDSTDTNSD